MYCSQVDPRVGGRFEIFGGAVRAVFTELSSQRIAFDWHFNSWKEGVVSKVGPPVHLRTTRPVHPKHHKTQQRAIRYRFSILRTWRNYSGPRFNIAQQALTFWKCRWS